MPHGIPEETDDPCRTSYFHREPLLDSTIPYPEYCLDLCSVITPPQRGRLVGHEPSKRRYERKIREFALFGSVLREDFSPHSDIDVLVTFSEDAEHSLFDLVHMEDELEALFGRSVDVVSRRGVQASRNYIRKNAILNSAEAIYAS